MIKYTSKNEPNKKIAKRKYIFIPEVKIKTAQEKTTNKVCPISGWIISNNEIVEIRKAENKYFEIIFNLLLQKIIARITTKKGFKTSIGWNLGKKNKSIHLFDPFTSTPIIGTKTRDNIEIKNRITEYFNNLFVSNEEKIKIIIIPIKT